MKKNLEQWQVEDAIRLKKLFEARAKESQMAFGEKHGIGSQGMVWQYINGHRALNLKALINFAKGLDIQPSEISPTLGNLLNTALKPTQTHPALARGLFPIEIKYVEGSCGGNNQQDYEPLSGTYVVKDIDWFARKGLRPEDATAILADGDSMEERIMDGDVVIFDTSKRHAVSGRIFLIDHAEGYRIKKLRQEFNGDWILENKNLNKRRHPDERILPSQIHLLNIKGQFVSREG